MSSHASKENGSEKLKPIFRDLTADVMDPEISEIESLCLQCGENGITKILLTKIPFYKEVVIMSFECKSCHWMNNELQPASTIQTKGVLFCLKVLNERDLTRQIVRTCSSSVMIPELEFEIPSQTQDGTITTIEGIIDRTCSGLDSKLIQLQEDDPSCAAKMEAFLVKFRKLKEGNVPFTFVLRDSTGNCFVENLCAPKKDPQLEISYFERSREENLMLGIYSEETPLETESPVMNEEASSMNDEVLGFSTNCHSCNAPCVTNMKLIQIPHFKDVVIMATACEVCGHKTNEVKAASGIEPLGVKTVFRITEAADLSRDLLKSDTCSIAIPEIELEFGASLLGSRYTTVEGILMSIKEQLQDSNPLISGDSADPCRRIIMEEFFRKLDEIISGTREATLILDDPCGNSYLQSIHYPNPDVNLTVEHYERTLEQDEELGLLDMKVEGYEES